MTVTARTWEPRDPAEAFFPVEMRPLFMRGPGSSESYNKLDRHFAVVDVERQNPFAVVTEEYKLMCSPDYLIRFTTPAGKTLLVGDACLSSPSHHGGNSGKLDSKPYTVERYRRTIAWATGDEVVRCHPMGGFVLFPPPSESWHEFTTLPGASDCMLLCPGPQDDAEARRRFGILLETIVPGLVAPANAEATQGTDAGNNSPLSH